MTRSLFAGVLAVAVSLLGCTAAASAADEKKADQKGGKVAGVVTSKGENFIEVKADGEEKARRYVPNWVGGAPAQGGGPDKKMMAEIGKTPVGARVELTWKFEERARVVDIKVLKAPEKKTDQ
ncbi:MAG: hypothetical protein JNM56_07320 [Planctomycetia bacterium]|nr:hypothetical protein [Planctomycetia bacterium]